MPIFAHDAREQKLWHKTYKKCDNKKERSFLSPGGWNNLLMFAPLLDGPQIGLRLGFIQKGLEDDAIALLWLCGARRKQF